MERRVPGPNLRTSATSRCRSGGSTTSRTPASSSCINVTPTRIVGVFRRLFDARFAIEEMRSVTGADLDAPPTGDGNNTAAFACRPARGSTRPSAHAEGLALDLNPFQNPYKRGDLVLPELASAYLDRTNRRPGMLYDGEVAVKAFASIGWSWGGRWTNPLDTMHFTATGR